MFKIGGNVGCQISKTVRVLEALPHTPFSGWTHRLLTPHPVLRRWRIGS